MQIAGDFDCHEGVFTQWSTSGASLEATGCRHWCLHLIAPAAAMVHKFVENTQNTTKTQLLASNYGIF